MIGFAKFMESTVSLENGNRGLADGIVRLLEKRTGKKFTCVQGMNFSNEIGCL